MFYRIIYSCLQAWRHRKSLATYATDGNLQIEHVVELSPAILRQKGIKGLVLDFDGVLAAHAKTKPIAEAERWLHECCKVLPQNRIFILSNKPTLARKQYFAENFPEINFIIAKHKKPFPHSILQILQDTNLLPKELLVIDDRICTGILAAIISNTQGCLVTNPYTDYTYSPILERLELLARNVERWLFTRFPPSRE